MAEVLQIHTPALGDRSYLVHDGQSALVVDPQRDIDRVLGLAAGCGVQITHVAETHIHNDYITGGLALARAAGASYLVNAADPVAFSRTPVRDGDTIRISDTLGVRVLATPGHTFTHLSYVLEDGGDVAGVFTGGSVLYGTTGRTDLLGPAHTQALASAQYASAQRLARELPDSAEIYPTHGFGSFCSVGDAGEAGAGSSTVGQQKLANPALTLPERAYLDLLLASLDSWPAYYAHMGPANLAGPGEPDLSPPRRADPKELRVRVEAGEWVIDLRAKVAFAAGFLPGTISFPLEGSFASYLGWTIPWGAQLTLLGETSAQVAEAQRELARIGYDHVAAAADGRPADWADGAPLAAMRLASFADLAATRRAAPPGEAAPASEAARAGQAATAGQAARTASAHSPRNGLLVLDVRRRLEWGGGHIAGAVHIPLHELSQRLDEIPPCELWVHCQSGYRSIVAASLLAARGRAAVSIDDDFGHAREAGLPLVPG